MWLQREKSGICNWHSLFTYIWIYENNANKANILHSYDWLSVLVSTCKYSKFCSHVMNHELSNPNEMGTRIFIYTFGMWSHLHGFIGWDWNKDCWVLMCLCFLDEIIQRAIISSQKNGLQIMGDKKHENSSNES